jgi:AAA domain, putative AbiEii toxin, Type IV TA system
VACRTKVEVSLRSCDSHSASPTPQELVRILAATVAGVGGLADGTTSLPEGPLAAFAGPNGTGKTKMLAAILAPWSRTLPSAVGETIEEVRVDIRLSDDERAAVQNLNEAMGWTNAVPNQFTAIASQNPVAGLNFAAEPSIPVLTHMFGAEEFLQRTPSLNVIYLPAERRLVAESQPGIHLNELNELIAWQKTREPRQAVRNYGQLDDQEFERFAKALCVADSLGDEPETSASADTRVPWSEFLATVNALIAPKALLPLTRKHPDELRILTPSGATHGVRDLSSGERQALIIVSRVLRAGGAGRVVLIDEPDAYLHPNLSRRLMQALERGIGDVGQLIVATHSPSVLDSLSPRAILRLGHDQPPRQIADEPDRLELYRSAGFRASVLTQSDLLVITEGKSDVDLLSLAFPDLARAATRSAGGRHAVIKEVEQLRPYDLPVVGVVDRDVLAPNVPEAIAGAVAI